MFSEASIKHSVYRGIHSRLEADSPFRQTTSATVRILLECILVTTAITFDKRIIL